MAEYKTFIPEAWTEFTAKCKALFPFLKKTFLGTRAAWDALTLEAKKNYDKADITDDLAGGELIVSDTVTEGDLNPVTSNAVSQACTQALGSNVTNVSVYSATNVAGNTSQNITIEHDGWVTLRCFKSTISFGVRLLNSSSQSVLTLDFEAVGIQSISAYLKSGTYTIVTSGTPSAVFDVIQVTNRYNA